MCRSERICRLLMYQGAPVALPRQLGWMTWRDLRWFRDTCHHIGQASSIIAAWRESCHSLSIGCFTNSEGASGMQNLWVAFRLTWSMLGFQVSPLSWVTRRYQGVLTHWISPLRNLGREGSGGENRSAALLSTLISILHSRSQHQVQWIRSQNSWSEA